MGGKGGGYYYILLHIAVFMVERSVEREPMGDGFGGLRLKNQKTKEKRAGRERDYNWETREV